MFVSFGFIAALVRYKWRKSNAHGGWIHIYLALLLCNALSHYLPCDSSTGPIIRCQKKLPKTSVEFFELVMPIRIALYMIATSQYKPRGRR
ncbi:hypothetical protein DFH05DRAFT_1489760, partial [Lentinula detonsa]